MPKRKKKAMNYMVSGKAINGGWLVLNFVSERPGQLEMTVNARGKPIILTIETSKLLWAIRSADPTEGKQ